MTGAADIFSLFSTPLGIHIVKLSWALAALVIAVLIGKALQASVVYLLSLTGVNSLSERIGLEKLLRKAEIKNPFSELAGDIAFWAFLFSSVVWIIYAFRFLRAISILRFTLHYISVNVVSAVFVFMLAVLLAFLLSQLISFIGALIYLPGYKLIARINLYVVVIFGAVAGLEKLGIPSSDIFRPDIILGFFALSGAIAFGLGCKDIAANFLANFLRGSR
ncbi:MAG: hypothetical protein WC490_04015 [Candidatus Margulisiibacteriota bacterium]